MRIRMKYHDKRKCFRAFSYRVVQVRKGIFYLHCSFIKRGIEVDHYHGCDRSQGVCFSYLDKPVSELVVTFDSQKEARVLWFDQFRTGDYHAIIVSRDLVYSAWDKARKTWSSKRHA